MDALRTAVLVALALFACLLVSFRHFARVGLLPLAIIGLWGDLVFE